MSGAPTRSRNRFEQTVRRLLDLVRLGTFLPGDRLPSERELAEQLGVSRSTLRAALLELRRAGWLEVSRGRFGGHRVADPLPDRVPEAGATDPPSRAVIADVLTLRGVIEVGAAGLAAQRKLTEEQATRLLVAHEQLTRAGADRYRALDAQWHVLVGELSGSPSLQAVVADVRARTTELLDHIPWLESNLENSTDQHRRLTEAIVAGEVQTAQGIMRRHLEGTEELLHGFLD